MSDEPTIQVLLNRFSQEIQSVFYPFLVVSMIERSGSASRQEIWDEIYRLSGGAFTCDHAAHHRQLGRLEKTFRLIKRLDKNREAALARYGLTAKGKRLYSESVKQVIDPLLDILRRD